MLRAIRTGQLTLLLLLLTGGSALDAQSVKDRLKAKAGARTDGKVDQALEKLLDQIENAVKCVAGDDECIQEAKKSGKKVVVTDEAGTILPPEQQPAGSPAKNAEAITAANAKASGEAPPQEESAAPTAAAKPVVWANYDFIPGERVLFADDFSNDRVGNFPQRLELVQGNMEVVHVDGKPFLRATSRSRFYVNLPEALPQRFTFEFDVSMPWWGMNIFAGPDGNGDVMDEASLTHSYVKISGTEAGVQGGTGAKSMVDPRSVTGVEEIAGHMFRVRVHGDGKYLKVYLDEKRIANIPNSNFNRSKQLVFDIEGEGETAETKSVLIGNLTVNAGGRDMYDALMADGRVVTQGIFFDVGSDRIRPESTPAMKIIGDMLKSHADLKLVVEGHTDNTGNAASNQTLSEKRARAIVAYLTSQFGIDGARLQAKGFGATRPAKPNDTPEGRQQNRRVELVKL